MCKIWSVKTLIGHCMLSMQIFIVQIRIWPIGSIASFCQYTALMIGAPSSVNCFIYLKKLEWKVVEPWFKLFRVGGLFLCFVEVCCRPCKL